MVWIAQHGQIPVHDLFHHIAADHMTVDPFAADGVDRLLLTRQEVHVLEGVAIVITVAIIGRRKLLQHIIFHPGFRFHIIDHRHITDFAVHKKQTVLYFHPLRPLFHRQVLLCAAVRMDLIQSLRRRTDYDPALLGNGQHAETALLLRQFCFHRHLCTVRQHQHQRRVIFLRPAAVIQDGHGAVRSHIHIDDIFLFLLYGLKPVRRFRLPGSPFILGYHKAAYRA